MLSIDDVRRALKALGYYDGKVTGAIDSNFRDDLKRFQRDYDLVPDGLYGAKSDAKLSPLWNTIKAANLPVDSSLRRWRLTYYYIGDQSYHTGTKSIPIYTPEGKLLSTVEPKAFVEGALEGTTKLRDGRIINVSGGYKTQSSNTLRPVYDIAKANGWLPSKAGWAGIKLSGSGNQAVANRCFKEITPGSTGYPVWNKIPADAFRTLAADIGRLDRHDPKYKGKGGVCPVGTKVFILEYVGVKLPDGTTHDGWFTVNDTGGGIYGAHYDVFVGSKKLGTTNPPPHLGHVWYTGIDKLSMDYSYGL